MKLSKKKVVALAMVVCLIATLSFGSLAWFTDDDSVKNDFMIAGSDKEDPEDIFSVDVWEGTDPENPEQEGLTYEKILPGDTLPKVAHVKNTGSYDQYIRVKITVSDAKVWQDVYKANMVPVTEFVNVDLTKVYEGKVGSYLDKENNNFVYYLYYNNILPLDNEETTVVDESDMIVFTEAYISGHLTKEQAFAMTKDGFQISVHADAVQTANVCIDDDSSNDAYEAFKTVGMEIPVNTAYASDRNEVIEAFANNKYIVLNANITNMNASHKIYGTDTELYLNDYTLETASGTFEGDNYGVKITGELAVSGYGTLRAGTLKIKVDKLTVYGGTLTSRNADGFIGGNNQPIVLP